MNNKVKFIHPRARGLLKYHRIKNLIEAVRKTPLEPIIRFGGRTYRNFIFRRTMKKVMSDPENFLNDYDTLAELSYGWANEGYSASVEYLQDCVQYTAQSELPILECGSGISTIVVGLIAKKYGNIVWTFEHSKPWYKRVKKTLMKYNIDSVKLNHGPMVEYGEYTWYKAPLDAMPSKFSLVLCDGPADVKTRAKQNIFPLMKDRFDAGSIVLYDDIPKIIPEDDIPGWIDRLNMSYVVRGTKNPYYYLKMP